LIVVVGVVLFLWQYFDLDNDGIVTRNDINRGCINIGLNFIATDDFIQDVSVKPPVDGSYNYEDQNNSFSMTPEEFMKGLAQTARENDTDLSPADMASAKKFIIPDGHGNVDLVLTMQKMAEVFKSPEFLKMLDDLKAMVSDASDVPTSQQPSDRPASIKPVTPSADTAAKQADDELLEKMRTIAGLR
jgi:hypothetical protein